MSEKRMFPLSVPITAFDKELTELHLRPASTADARAIGALPYAIRQDQSVALDLAVCAKYISRLADIPGSSVDKLALPDFNQLAWEVAQHFLGQGSTSSES